jgi:hypothetical protein
MFRKKEEKLNRNPKEKQGYYIYYKPYELSFFTIVREISEFTDDTLGYVSNDGCIQPIKPEFDNYCNYLFTDFIIAEKCAKKAIDRIKYAKNLEQTIRRKNTFSEKIADLD